MKQLVKVKAIYLSHAHLDHYNGVFTFVKARQRAVEKLKDKDDKVFICAPANLFSLFKTTSSLFQPEVNHPDGLFLSSINLIDNHWLDYSDKPVRRTTDRTELIKQRVDSLKAALGLSNIEAMPVVHIENATALVFKHQLTNFKLVFSGDCVPSAELVKLGQQCDLLIHEATYSKHDVARAFENKHSTVLQAIEVGKSMKAAHTCITHFGKKILQRHSEEVFQNKDIIVAHDNMLLNRKNLGLAKRLNKELEEINNTINSTTLIINNFFS
jgi:ribonuclease Z